MKILVTGTAGFIGYHVALKLLERGDEVIGLDSINDYYDVNLKYGRLEASGIPRAKVAYNQLVRSDQYDRYSFIQLNLEDQENMARFFRDQQFDRVCHLAAQAAQSLSCIWQGMGEQADKGHTPDVRGAQYHLVHRVWALSTWMY